MDTTFCQVVEMLYVRLKTGHVPEDMSLSAVAPEESPESPPPPASSSLPRTGPLPHRPPPPPAPWPPVAAAAGGVTATLELRPAGLDPAAASWHPDDWDPDGTMFEDDEEEGAERAFASLDPPGSAPRRGGWLAPQTRSARGPSGPC